MESVGILRALWRRRILVGLGALLAFAIAVSALYQVSLSPPGLRAKTTSSGFAWQRLLVDTSTSLLADAKARGAEGIASKAVLLGSLLGGDPARKSMAREVGAQPAQIAVIGPGSLIPAMVTPLAVQAIEVTKPSQPYAVTVSEDPGLPILSIFATAPDEKSAGKLVDGARDTLSSLGSEAPGTAGDAKIEPLSKPQTGTKVEGVGKLKALIASIMVMLIWSTGVVLFDGVRQRRLAV